MQKTAETNTALSEHRGIGAFLLGILLRFIALTVAFFVAMVAVTAIPADMIRDNVKNSIAENAADIAANTKLTDEAAQASTYTTDIMFSIMLSQDSDRLLESAMDGAYYWDGDNSVKTLVKHPDLEPTIVYSYYWHGWAAVLKPLLIFLDYASLKRLFAIIFIVSIVALTALLDRALKPRRGWLFAAAIAAAIALIRGLDAITVLPFFFTIEIGVLGSCWLVWASMKKRRRNRIWAYLGFFTIGALTAFFDFLITPLVAYALPAICLLLVECLSKRGRDQAQFHIRDVFILIIVSGICWLVGYAGLWAMKWVLASIVLGYNVIQEALGEILFRVNATDSSQWATASNISAFTAVKKNIRAAFPIPFIVMGLLIIIASAVAACVQHRKVNWALVIGLLIIAVLPYLWYAAAANHSQIHYYFTCRNQIATIAALLSLCAYGAFVADRPGKSGEHGKRGPSHAAMEKPVQEPTDREQLI